MFFAEDGSLLDSRQILVLFPYSPLSPTRCVVLNENTDGNTGFAPFAMGAIDELSASSKTNRGQLGVDSCIDPGFRVGK